MPQLDGFDSAGSDDGDGCYSFERLMRDVARAPVVDCRERARVYAPGTRLDDGRYEITREAGRGGHGLVYVAEDRLRLRTVAVKALGIRHPEAIERFKREFRTLTDVVHEHLVTVYELFEQDGDWYFTMEFVEGRHGLGFARPVRSDAPTEAWRHWGSMWRRLVEGVHTMHLHGRIHRDLKPANIRVDPHGRVVVLDLGLAISIRGSEDLEEASRAGTSGTPNYMAPEQKRGDTIGVELDFYAVGVMLFEALCGRLPVSESESGSAHVVKELREQAPDAPSEWLNLCARLLDPVPGNRPSADEIVSVVDPEFGSLPNVGVSRTKLPASGFVGRDSELGQLERWMLERDAERVFWARVTGPSGIGKTALVDEFAKRVQTEHRAVVFRGRGRASERFSFGTLEPLVRQLVSYLMGLTEDHALVRMVRGSAGTLVRMFPEFGRVAEAPVGDSSESPEFVSNLRADALLRFSSILTTLATHERLVLIVDDAQWIDPDSRQLLNMLARGPGGLAAMVVTVERDRPSEAEHWPSFEFEVAPRVGASAELRIEPLAREQAMVLARKNRPRDTAEETTFERLVERVGGHPYYLLRALQREQSEIVESSSDLNAYIDALIGELSAPARHLLNLIALSVGPLDAELIAASSPSSRLWSEIAGLVSSSLVCSHGVAGHEFFEPHHDFVRTCIRESLCEVRKRQCHAELAALYEAHRPSQPERIAHHLEASGEACAAASWHERAATSASARLAFEAAVGHFDAAIHCGDHPAAKLSMLRRAKADALAALGHGREAGETYLAAIGGEDPDESIELRALAADQYLFSGHYETGVEILREVLRAHGIVLPTTKWRRRWLTWVMLVQLQLMGRPGAAAASIGSSPLPSEDPVIGDIMERAGLALVYYDTELAVLLLAGSARHRLRSGHPASVARGLASVAELKAGMTPADEAGVGGRLAVARALGEQAGDAELLTHLRFTETRCDTLTSRPGFVHRAIASLNPKHLPNIPFGSHTAMFRADAGWLRGNAREMHEFASRQIGLSRPRNDRLGVMHSAYYAAMAALADDRIEDARAWIEEGRACIDLRVCRYMRSGFDTASSIIDRYQGIGPESADTWIERERQSASSGLRTVESHAVWDAWIHASSMLGLVQLEPDCARWKREFRRARRILGRLGIRHAGPIGRMLDQCLAHTEGRVRARSLGQLWTCAAELDRLEMHGWAAAIRYATARMQGGPPGAANAERAAAALSEHGVKHPQRWAGVWCPLPDRTYTSLR